MLINLPHSLSTVRQYTTVKEVRSHSERGKAAVPRVVGIVVALPCCGMEAIASVMSPSLLEEWCYSFKGFHPLIAIVWSVLRDRLRVLYT